MPGTIIDRDFAAVVTAAVVQIVREGLLAWLHRDASDMAGVRAAIEALLRAEFDDVARRQRSIALFDGGQP